jgi:hypothetical protein
MSSFSPEQIAAVAPHVAGKIVHEAFDHSMSVNKDRS